MNRSVLFCFCALLSSTTIAQSESDTALDATLDFDMPVDVGEASIVETTQTTDKPSMLENMRFGFAYQVGSQLEGFPEIASNRLDNRLRWERLLSANLFASVDGKIILRAWKDQQLESDREVSAELRMREAAIQASLGSLAIKAGYQTIIWGEMDSARITDVMTPWDYSEFAFTSPEDARVGQPSILVDWFSKKSSLRVAINPLPLTNRYPGGDASGLLAFMLGTEDYHVNESTPEFGTDYEVGLRLKHNLGPSDIALYAARVVSDDPLFQFNSSSSLSVPDFDIQYKSYELIGFSANYGKGNFLWKTETGLKNNLYIPDQDIVIRDTVEAAIGVDYNANGAYNLTLEIQHQYILPGDGNLQATKNHNSQAMLRWSKNFLHDTLSTVYYASYQLQYGDMTHSAALQYAINDYWRVDLNATIFVVENVDSPYRFVDDWDMVSLRINLDI